MIANLLSTERCGSGRAAPALPSHIPSLDGLRMISIGLVIFSHALGTGIGLELTDFYAGLGNLGVRIFFVISGFLITTLLLKELDETGDVSLREFYMRRFFRIFPAFYVYLGVIAVLVATKRVAVYPGDIAHAATYTMNYHFPHSWYLAHIWSLSVEEQFYLIWPTLLWALSVKRATKALIGVIAVSPVARLVIWMFLPSQRIGLGQEFHTVADALAAGCLLAILHNRLGELPGYLRFLKSRVMWFAPAAVITVNASQLGPTRLWVFVGQTVLNCLIAVCIDKFIRFPHGPMGRLLNWPPARLIGTWSYSLYLWQQVFLNRESSLPVHRWPLNMVLVFVAAAASYYAVERPFLRLKARISAAIRGRERGLSATVLPVGN